MSLYWYAYCPDCKVSCEVGDSHGDGPVRFEEEFGFFVRKHAACAIKFCCDPDPESDPEYFECIRDG